MLFGSEVGEEVRKQPSAFFLHKALLNFGVMVVRQTEEPCDGINRACLKVVCSVNDLIYS